MTHRTLTLSTGTFDQDNTFLIFDERSPATPIRCSLMKGYEKRDDGVFWAMNTGGAIKAAYTDADRAEQARLTAEGAIRNGDVVMIDGKPHEACIFGRHSNAAIFNPISAA